MHLGRKDLASIGDTVTIAATKEGIKFTTSGDVGTANITLRWVGARGKQRLGEGVGTQVTGLWAGGPGFVQDSVTSGASSKEGVKFQVHRQVGM